MTDRTPGNGSTSGDCDPDTNIIPNGKVVSEPLRNPADRQRGWLNRMS
ncbi:hypothetical protein [Actinopolymorpha alba]|nr:hypothetical protein [Actinopolymorpha alba]